jgi:hypothetical protein
VKNTLKLVKECKIEKKERNWKTCIFMGARDSVEFSDGQLAARGLIYSSPPPSLRFIFKNLNFTTVMT